MKPRNRPEIALALVLLFAASRAEAAPDDGVYGRLDGDLGLSFGAGVGIDHGGAFAALLGRAIFVDTAGIYASYTDSFASGRPVVRSFSTGIELRPLFLARFANNLEQGPARLDLAIDSLALNLGAFWRSPSQASPALPGLEFGAGFEVPLFARASGPWIGARGVLRWAPADFAGSFGSAEERGAFAMFTLSWHGRVTSRIADAGDIRPR